MLRAGTDGAFTSRRYFPRWVCLRFMLLTWCLTVTASMIACCLLNCSAAFVELQGSVSESTLGFVSGVFSSRGGWREGCKRDARGRWQRSAVMSVPGVRVLVFWGG